MSIPFACDMTALTADQRARHAVVMREVFSAVQVVRVIADGYEFGLGHDAAALLRIAEFITLERLCCPFFRFVIHVPAAPRPVALQVVGPAGVRPFIRAEFGTALPESIRFPPLDSL